MRMIQRWAGFILAVLLSGGTAWAQLPTAPASDSGTGNLVMNGGFESDWIHRGFTERRRFLLLQASDRGVAESDGLIDHWNVLPKKISPPEVWDLQVAHSGSRSLRFKQAAQATNEVRFTGETYWRSGGAYYAAFCPLDKDMAAQVAKRAIVIGAWCKAADVPKGGLSTLSVRIACGARPDSTKLYSTPQVDKDTIVASVTFSGGTHDWEYRQIRIEPAKIKSAPFLGTITVAFNGKAGTVWFDDVTCVEEPSPDQPNRLANAGFEAIDGDGWATNWSKPVMWAWFRNVYYTFTGWSHQANWTWRGGAAVDPWIASSGGRSLRLTVLPGDNFAVASEVIQLNQAKPHPIEFRAMVKADNLRTLEIMAQDETGQWLPQGDFLGDDMEEPGSYNMGTTGAGTYDWMMVRKYFAPRKPVKSLRLFLCVRGFDGTKLPDKNIVGTVWLDDLQLFEHGVARAGIAAASIPKQPQQVKDASEFRGFHVTNIDLGQRLWGKNRLAMTIEFEPRAAAAVAGATLEITLTDPAGQSKPYTAKAHVLRSPDGNVMGLAEAASEYTVDNLCRDWKEQYKIALRLVTPGGNALPPTELAFGTPSEILRSGASAYYLYPDEKELIYANLNIADGSLADLDRCEITMTRAGQATSVLDQRDFSNLHQPRTAPPYINTRNFVAAEIAGDKAVIHPWSDPVLDSAAQIRLFKKGQPKPLAESPVMMFGFITPFPKPDLPDAIEKTAVNDRGFITVNGKPFFPVYWTPHWGESPEADWTPKQLGYKELNLTSIVYSKNAAPDEEVKAALLAKINTVKNDPKFFQYILGEGEMQLQGGNWAERIEWCKTAIGWIRQADPNHVIGGASNWLVGHPRHDEIMQKFVGFWDQIGVETSFETQPLINKFAKPLMKDRHTAVLVGLETYDFQTSQVLRWRGYRAVLDGASGIGLCPSGMMQSSPQQVNYLRGLNGEFRGLAPVIMADEPANKVTVDSDRIETLQRVLDGKHYILAVRNKDDAGAIKARFAIPADLASAQVRVLFEDRKIQVEGSGFADEFSGPQTVHVYELAKP